MASVKQSNKITLKGSAAIVSEFFCKYICCLRLCKLQYSCLEIRGMKNSEIVLCCISLSLAWFHVETDRYHLFETDTDIFNFFAPIFGQLQIFNWPPIPIFQNLLTVIFADMLTKYFG